MNTPIPAATEYPIDGFMLNAYLRDLTARYFPAAIDQLADIRDAMRYRPRVWIAPEDVSVVIPARSQYSTQLQIGPDTLIWGLRFAIYDPGSVGTATTDFKFMFQDADMYSKSAPMQSSFESAAAYALNTTSAPSTSKYTPVIITPRQFESGLLNVLISNHASTDGQCQMLLFCVEPKPYQEGGK